MEISLDQAIEIHAKVLLKRHRNRAPAVARAHAAKLKYGNDFEGQTVWLRVASIASALIDEDKAEHREHGER